MILEEELIAIKPMQKPYVNITWQVSDFCNYKCSYCNPGNWAGKNKKDDGFEEIIANLALNHTIARAEGDRGVVEFDQEDDEDGQEEGNDVIVEFCEKALEDDSYDL